jgi:hypothetical protein
MGAKVAENRFKKYVEQPNVFYQDPVVVAEQQRAAEDQAAQRRGEERDSIRTGIAVRGESREVDNKAKDYLLRLSGDYNADPAVKTYRVAIQQLAQAIGTGAGPQADLALTYAFAKAMDPDSVVREAEQGMVTESQPWFQAAVERTKKQFGMDGAGNYTPETREELRKQISNSVAQRVKVYDARRGYFEKQAREVGVDPSTVLGEHDAAPFVPALKEWVKQANARDRGEAPEGQELLGYRPQDGAPPYPIYGTPGTEVPDLISPDDYQSSIAGQGISGVNEGIASTLGLPVDALTWAMNLVPQGINAAANTDIPTIEDPMLGGDWWRDKMNGWAIYEESANPRAQFARRVGQSAGAAVVPAGFAGNLARSGAALASGTAGGFGGATAQQVAPGNVEAEIIAELIAGGGSGAGLAKFGQRARQQAIEDAVPTVPELKQQASSLYKQAEARGVTADPMLTKQLADDMRATLRAEGRVSPTGRISEVYPKAREAMQLVDDYAGQPMNPTQMQTVRSVIADGANSAEPAERRIASLLLDTFDDFVDPLAPDLADARSVASRYLNAEKLEQARELAGAQAGQFTGSGYENALRTQYRALDRNAIKGRGRYGDEVLEALQNVSRGTPLSNAARSVGRFAPTGVVSGTLATGIPFSIGNAVGGPGLGAAASLATLTAGTGGRALATKLGIRNADIAELIARNGGALDQAEYLDEGTKAIVAALAATEAAKYLDEESRP